MKTMVRTQEFCATNVQIPNTKEPTRLSKAETWRRKNPGGWITVIDRKAVNK